MTKTIKIYLFPEYLLSSFIMPIINVLLKCMQNVLELNTVETETILNFPNDETRLGSKSFSRTELNHWIKIHIAHTGRL